MINQKQQSVPDTPGGVEDDLASIRQYEQDYAQLIRDAETMRTEHFVDTLRAIAEFLRRRAK